MPDDPLDALRRRLIASALTLADALDAAIADAPLHQRASALGLIIDRLLKLEALEPHRHAPAGEEVIRVEYTYPDGSVHHHPPWAADDSAFEGPISRGRVRSPFWENRDRQADDPGDGAARG